MQNQNFSSNPQSPHGSPRVAPQTNLQQPWRETYAAAPRAQQPYPNAAVPYVRGTSLANPVSGLSGSEHLGPVAPQQSYPQPPDRPHNPMPVNPHPLAWYRPRNTPLAQSQQQPLREVDGNSKTSPIVLDEDEAPRKGSSTTSPIVLDEDSSPREQPQPTQPKWVNVTERVYRLERAPEEDDIAHWAWYYMSWMWSFGKHFGSNKGSKTHRWYVDPEDHKMLHCVRVCDGVKMRHWELQTKLETLQAELAKEQADLAPRRLPSPSGPSNQKGVRKEKRKEREQEKEERMIQHARGEDEQAESTSPASSSPSAPEVGRKRKAREEGNEDSAKRVRLQPHDEEAIAEDEVVEEDEADKALVASCVEMMGESEGEVDEVVEEDEDDKALTASCEGMMEESEEEEEDEERDEELEESEEE